MAEKKHNTPRVERDHEHRILGGPDIADGMPPGPSADAASVDLDAKSPLRQMFAIAAPSVVTMTSYTVMAFVDRLMVKEIGPGPEFVAAQGTAGITTWTFMTFCVGLTGVVSSFVSQNFGAGKPERGAAYAWNAIWMSIVYWALIMLPSAAMAGVIFRAYPMEQHVHDMAVGYATIAMAGSVFTLMAKGLHNYFFGLHRPGVVMVAVVAGNIANVFFNMVFMFGPEGLGVGGDGAIAGAVRAVAEAGGWVAGTLGIPALGLRGAAIGTVLGTVIEFGLPMAVFMFAPVHRGFGSLRAWRVSRVCLMDLVRVGWPGGLMFLNDLICWAYMMQVLTPKGAQLAAQAAGAGEEAVKAAGTAALTAGHIALQWMHLSFMPAVGISIATQAMVGKAVGAGRTDLAERYTWLGTRLTMVYMGVCGIAFVLFSGDLVNVFINAETPEAQRAVVLALGVKIMYAAAVFQLFDALAITMSAALRGAGDTIWPGVAAVVLSWACIVGLGHTVLLVRPETGGLSAWIGASAYIVTLGIALMARFIRGRWKTLSLVRDGGPDSPGSPPAAGGDQGSHADDDEGPRPTAGIGEPAQALS